ncbi:MAG: ribosome maturation factor [Bacteroidota bacterium]|nr:ribosome maturation factor [Bacteroidota bacterium]
MPNYSIFAPAKESKKGTKSFPSSFSKCPDQIMKEDSILKEITSFVNEYTAASATLFLVEIKVLPGNKVKVFVDADDGITIDKCTKLNRALYKYIEDKGLFDEGGFSLEVSSPGVDEPLKLHRQYAKNVGRKIEVIALDGSQTEGTLVKVDETGITVEQVAGRGKKAVTSSKNFSYNEIKHAKVLITF